VGTCRITRRPTGMPSPDDLMLRPATPLTPQSKPCHDFLGKRLGMTGELPITVTRIPARWKAPSVSYNGNSWCNQFVLGGGSAHTSSDHIRSAIRNIFFPPDRTLGQSAAFDSQKLRSHSRQTLYSIARQYAPKPVCCLDIPSDLTKRVQTVS